MLDGKEVEDTSTDTTADKQDTTLTVDPVMSVDKWRDTLPEDIRNEKVIQETPDLTTLAKRVIDGNNFISKSIRLPDDGDTSGMDELYNKLGRPEAVEGYDIKRPDIPEGSKYDEGLEKSFLEAAHKIGLNSSQANALISWNQEQALSQAANGQQTLSDGMASLRKEWGGAFDERVKIAEEVLNQYGNDTTDAMVKDNAGLISLIYEMGKNLVEGTAQGISTASHLRTPEEAKAEILKLQGDKEWMNIYAKDKRHVNHHAYVEQMRQLNVEAYPEPEPVVY